MLLQATTTSVRRSSAENEYTPLGVKHPTSRGKCTYTSGRRGIFSTHERERHTFHLTGLTTTGRWLRGPSLLEVPNTHLFRAVQKKGKVDDNSTPRRRRLPSGQVVRVAREAIDQEARFPGFFHGLAEEAHGYLGGDDLAFPEKRRFRACFFLVFSRAVSRAWCLTSGW